MPTQTKNKPIRVGIFAHVDGAENAVRELVHAGFPKEHITVICSDATHEKHFGALRHSAHGIGKTDRSIIVESSLLGGLLGGVAALVGVALTGGLGIVAVGPIVAGGIAGTLFGVFLGRGVEDEVARLYEQEVARGSILVAIEHEDPERLAVASRLFEECGSRAIPLDEG